MKKQTWKNDMKRSTLLSILIITVFGCLAAYGQTNSAPSWTSPQPPAANIWQAIIPVLVPVLIGLVKLFIPKIPSAALPIIAPILGAVADLVIHFSTGNPANPLLGSALGAAGVGIREIYDQVRQKMIPPTA